MALDQRGDGVPGTTVEEAAQVVYAGALEDEQTIALEVQAAVVEDLEDFATVRFVDDRREATDESTEGAPVLEDGVLLLLGPVPTGSVPSVEVERYVDVDDAVRFRVSVRRSGDGWDVTAMDPVGL